MLRWKLGIFSWNMADVCRLILRFSEKGILEIAVSTSEDTSFIVVISFWTVAILNMSANLHLTLIMMESA